MLARLPQQSELSLEPTHPRLTRGLSSIQPRVHHGERRLGPHQGCRVPRSKCCALQTPGAALAVALLQHHTAAAALKESGLVRVVL